MGGGESGMGEEGGVKGLVLDQFDGMCQGKGASSCRSRPTAREMVRGSLNGRRVKFDLNDGSVWSSPVGFNGLWGIIKTLLRRIFVIIDSNAYRRVNFTLISMVSQDLTFLTVAAMGLSSIVQLAGIRISQVGMFFQMLHPGL